MVDAWGGWSLFQELLRMLKSIAVKHGVSIPTIAVRYILDQVNFSIDSTFPHVHLSGPPFFRFFIFSNEYCIAASCGGINGWR